MPKYRHGAQLSDNQSELSISFGCWSQPANGRRQRAHTCRPRRPPGWSGSLYWKGAVNLTQSLYCLFAPLKVFVCSVRQLPVTAILKGFIAVKYQSHQDTFLLSARSAAKSQYEWEINWQYSPQLMLTTPWCLLTGTNVIITSAQTYSRSTNYQLVNNDFKSIWAIEM